MSSSKIARQSCRPQQNGVVLIVALLMLMVLSILASMSIRGSSSTEQVANQSRLKTLAQQSAEHALRYCESQVQAHELDVANGVAAPRGFTPQAAPVGAGTKYNWETLANWQRTDISANTIANNTAGLKFVPFTANGDAAAAGGAAAVTFFAHPPECMTQYVVTGNSKLFVTTARGLGPEVGTKENGVAPNGTEVWLQSFVTMQ